jgi:hypothetical protein
LLTEFEELLIASGFALLLLAWIAISIGRAVLELRRATAYLQQLCWRADEDHGELPQEWRDPARRRRAGRR